MRNRTTVGIATLLCSISLCYAQTAPEEDAAFITITQWEETSHANRWIANIGDGYNQGTLELIIDTKDEISFIMKRKCRDVPEIEYVIWKSGAQVGNWRTCDGIDAVAFTPPAIEIAAQPFPSKVRQYLQKSYKPLRITKMVKTT